MTSTHLRFPSVCFTLHMQPDTPVPTPQKEHSKRGNRRHAPFTFNHNPTALSLLHHCIPLMSSSFPLFFPAARHHAFEAFFLSPFIPPPLPVLKGWSVTELVASFIGVSQQPGDKGELKCHNVSIFCPCADAHTWKEADIQSSALKSSNKVGDG